MQRDYSISRLRVSKRFVLTAATFNGKARSHAMVCIINQFLLRKFATPPLFTFTHHLRLPNVQTLAIALKTFYTSQGGTT